MLVTSELRFLSVTNDRRRARTGFRFHNFAQWGFWRKLLWQDTPVKQDTPIKLAPP